MKKLLISALILLGMGTTAKAQDYLFDNPDNKAYFGARLGFDIMSLQGPSAMYSNSGGVHIGGIYNMPLWKNLFFEPELAIFYNRANIKEWFSPVQTEPTAARSNGTVNNWGIRLPLNVGFHFDVTDNIQIIPFTGPVFNFNFSSSTNYQYLAPQNIALNYNSVDMGWDFGVGVQVQHNYYIGVGGTVGMTRYVKADYGAQARRNLFTISLGYNF